MAVELRARLGMVRRWLAGLLIATTAAGCFGAAGSELPSPVVAAAPPEVAARGARPLSAGPAGLLFPVEDPLDGLPEPRVVWEWGHRWGNGPVSPYPKQVHPLTGVVQVAAGLEHGLALRGDGTVWSWGSGGQLLGGVASVGANPIPARVSGLSDVVAITAGDFHNLALRADGTVWSWGYNASGQLGDGTRDSRRQPAMIDGLDDVVAVSAGMSHSLALRRDGTVRAWGYGVFGAIGNGTNSTSLRPSEVLGLDEVVSIAAGGRHSLAARADGSVWGWGFGIRGAIGDTSWGVNVPRQIPELAGVNQVAAGWNHSLAVTAAGELYTWGENEYGQLGRGTQGGMSPTPQLVEGLGPIVSVAGSEQFTVAVAADGEVYTWGDPSATGLRRDEGTPPARPAPVVALHGVTSVAARGNSVIVIQAHQERRLEPPRFVSGGR